MKTIIGQSTEVFDRQTKMMEAREVAVILVVICLNIFLTLLRNDSNHNILLWGNILLDIICVWGVMLYNALRVAPRKKLQKLLQLPIRELCGTVKSIEAHTTRYMDFDCYAVQIDEEILYLIQESAFRIQINDYVKLQTSAGIIVGVAE